MNTNSDTISESTASEDLPLVRISNFSSPENLPKSEAENDTACESKGADDSVISRPPMTTSNSVNETPKSKRRTKKERSLIPRTKSRRRNEKYDVPPKVELQKSEKNDATVSINSLPIENAEPVSSMDRIDSEPPGIEEKEEKELDYLEEKAPQNSSTSFISCRDYSDVLRSPDRNALENSRKGTETVGFLKPIKSGNLQENSDRLEKEKAIRNLYEIVKSAIGPAFVNLKSSKTGIGNKKINVSESDSQQAVNVAIESFPSIQGQYEFTLKEISNIWRNTISLISSVRDHVIQFVEKDAKSVDQEQLTLEAEMLGLAIDVAISYSKLKMDSLIQAVKKCTKGKKFKKTDLEEFMDSKAFSFLYSDDDLAAMARTVRDLKVSLLKSEDPDME